MKMLLLGAAGVLALQALLVVGYLAVSEQDPIVLNPDRRVDKAGVTMVMYCGYSRPAEMLDGVPPDGNSGPWTRGRTIWGDCEPFYHHGVGYRQGGD